VEPPRERRPATLADVVGDQSAERHEGHCWKDEVEEVVRDHCVQLIEQDVAGFAQDNH
jgi:hypothetical protein